VNIINTQKGKDKSAAKMASELINQKLKQKTINIINTQEKTKVKSKDKTKTKSPKIGLLKEELPPPLEDLPPPDMDAP